MGVALDGSLSSGSNTEGRIKGSLIQIRTWGVWGEKSVFIFEIFPKNVILKYLFWFDFRGGSCVITLSLNVLYTDFGGGRNHQMH